MLTGRVSTDGTRANDLTTPWAYRVPHTPKCPVFICFIQKARSITRSRNSTTVTVDAEFFFFFFSFSNGNTVSTYGKVIFSGYRFHGCRPSWGGPMNKSVSTSIRPAQNSSTSWGQFGEGCNGVGCDPVLSSFNSKGNEPWVHFCSWQKELNCSSTTWPFFFFLLISRYIN